MMKVQLPRNITEALNFIKTTYAKIEWKVPTSSYPTPLYVRLHNLDWQIAFMVEDAAKWNQEQVITHTLGVLGILQQIERNLNMSYAPAEKQEAIDAGREIAEALLPFLNINVPSGAELRLGLVISAWAGMKDNANFMLGFASVFNEQRANSRNNAIERGGAETTTE